jgi:hypothetical protein
MWDSMPPSGCGLCVLTHGSLQSDPVKGHVHQVSHVMSVMSCKSACMYEQLMMDINRKRCVIAFCLAREMLRGS